MKTPSVIGWNFAQWDTLCAKGHSTRLAGGTLFADNRVEGKLSKQGGDDAVARASPNKKTGEARSNDVLIDKESSDGAPRLRDGTSSELPRR